MTVEKFDKAAELIDSIGFIKNNLLGINDLLNTQDSYKHLEYTTVNEQIICLLLNSEDLQILKDKYEAELNILQKEFEKL